MGAPSRPEAESTDSEAEVAYFEEDMVDLLADMLDETATRFMGILRARALARIDPRLELAAKDRLCRLHGSVDTQHMAGLARNRLDVLRARLVQDLSHWIDREICTLIMGGGWH